MTNRLAENIRVFRKERGLTQEQLAEVLGVTTGAVYKWEARLAQPELGMLMELADFFDTSVDALLGYEMKDNRLQVTVERLRRYRDEKDRNGLAEEEKALRALESLGIAQLAARPCARISGGSSLEDALHFANAAGAFSTTRAGAQPAMPSLEEINLFLQEKGDVR